MSIKTTNAHSFFIPLFKFLIDEDLVSQFYFSYEDDEFFTAVINCNDQFFWGAADGEDVTLETLPALKQAVIDCKEVDQSWGLEGPLLYAARQRKLRPQGAAYTYIPKDLWPLFNAVGGKREINLLNPHHIGEYRPGRQVS